MGPVRLRLVGLESDAISYCLTLGLRRQALRLNAKRNFALKWWNSVLTLKIKNDSHKLLTLRTDANGDRYVDSTPFRQRIYASEYIAEAAPSEV